MGDLARNPPTVETDSDRAERLRREERHDPFGSVGSEDAHTVALADAVLVPQSSCQRGDGIGVLGDRDSTIAGDEIVAVAPGARCRDEFTDGVTTVLHHGHDGAENLFFDDLEWPTWTGEA